MIWDIKKMMALSMLGGGYYHYKSELIFVVNTIIVSNEMFA